MESFRLVVWEVQKVWGVLPRPAPPQKRQRLTPPRLPPQPPPVLPLPRQPASCPTLSPLMLTWHASWALYWGCRVTA